MEPYFIWNGIDSRSMGLVLVHPPAHTVAAERVTSVAIPGRSGYLTLPEGLGVYDGYTLTLEVGNRRTASPAAITTWLRGSGELVLSSEPDRVYFGRLVKEGSLKRLFANVYSGPLAFTVQPLKGQYPPEPPITITAKHYLLNPGDVPARPRYTINGTGRLLLGVGYSGEYKEYFGVQISVDLRDTSYKGAVIDADSMMVSTLDGTVNLGNVSELHFGTHEGLRIPVTGCGIIFSSIGGSISSVRIEPRWRWL